MCCDEGIEIYVWEAKRIFVNNNEINTPQKLIKKQKK